MMRLATYIGAAVLGIGVAVSPASAALCPDPTSCELILDETNSSFSTTGTVQTGDFGTVTLTLTGHTVKVDVDLASGFKIIETGFPGSFGFHDSLGGGLTIGNFSSSAYSGAKSDHTDDLHFGGFGYANDAAATTGPHAGSSTALKEVSFTVSKGTSLTSVNQLLNLFSPAGGDGPTFFVVDAFDSNAGGNLGGRTGLLGVSGIVVPEPRGEVFLLFGLLVIAARSFYRYKKHKSLSLN